MEAKLLIKIGASHMTFVNLTVCFKVWSNANCGVISSVAWSRSSLAVDTAVRFNLSMMLMFRHTSFFTSVKHKLKPVIETPTRVNLSDFTWCFQGVGVGWGGVNSPYFETKSDFFCFFFFFLEAVDC